MSITLDEIDNDFVDEYRVSIPNKKEEFLIPGKCVRTIFFIKKIKFNNYQKIPNLTAH